MWHRICLSCALTLTAGCWLISPARAADRKTKEQPTLSNLSLEVAALETLHRFQMTPAQLEMLRKLAAETAPKGTSREEGQGSAKLRQTLVDLREALIRGDENQIERLQEQLDDLLGAQDTDLDDAVELTAVARRRAGEVLQSLTPRQVGAFLNNLGDELPEPLERLLSALDAAGKLGDDDWKELAEEIVEELSWQLGGVDAERSRFVGDKVATYLKMVRGMGDKEIKKQRPELERAARQFVSQVSPTLILHNVTENALAELLSNPRLKAALDARLRK